MESHLFIKENAWKFYNIKKQNKKVTKTKKGGKEFDVEDNKQSSEKSKKTKKEGKEFDVEDVKDKSNAEKLAHTIRLKNMFVGLFVIASILSLFLIFRYSDKMSDYSGKKRQFEAASKSVQSLKQDLNEMTSSRDSWRSEYYDMENDRDYWYDDRNDQVRKWNNHVAWYYCYDNQMCNCW